ncbi:aldolase [Paenibacillus baekrokdamisoli]|uniref:Aldolase n=1 Tax=Paenibacillus baekrokdamisoli TaxID=1712516 RepID=A0A3G9IXH9_9BACL|nr:class II aldolase/adducin family protein [Paenibacillus baekrokdamisoli]MBB3068775.1 L-fuculose-phosphate aldolase [Paenibacillus baekrokdamisoli]BBH23607.1 aldolase [Paenibacillus baekrokdamisoli]
MSKPDHPLLNDLIYYSNKVVEKNLVVGPGGNTSVRIGGQMWISPSGFSLDNIEAPNWVPVDIETGECGHAELRPSSEVLFHLYIYRERPDVTAIVHTHPPITIGLISSGRDDIPALFPDQVVLLGDVPCLEYITPCTKELADAVIGVLRNPSYNALLMKNHGLITLGTSMKQAYYRTELMEDAARVFWIASSMGQPRILTEQEKQDILNLEAEKYRQQLAGS